MAVFFLLPLSLTTIFLTSFLFCLGCCTLLTNNKTFEEVCKDVTVDEEINQVFRAEARINPRDLYLSSDNFEEVEKHQLVNLLIINHIETGTTVLEEAYMTEIQLRRILDRTGSDMGDQQSDGDERMTKDGEDISKFSKEAMTLGDDVYEFNDHAPIILKKVYLLYDKYVGEDKVFPTKNGAPRIMTKYKDIPYTYATNFNPSTRAVRRNSHALRLWTGQGRPLQHK